MNVEDSILVLEILIGVFIFFLTIVDLRILKITNKLFQDLEKLIKDYMLRLKEIPNILCGFLELFKDSLELESVFVSTQ